jgi:cysteine desulfurase family protein
MDMTEKGPITYLDSAATSYPKSERVITAVTTYLRNAGSPGRSGHRLARWADEQVWAAREQLAILLNAPSPERVTFAVNATMALNAVANHLGHLGGRVLSSSFEHNSVTRPLRALETKGIIEYELVPPSRDEPLDLDWLEAQISEGGVSGVVLTWASNVSGTVMPVRDVSAVCRKYGVLFVVDAAQAAGHVPVDAPVADVLVFAGHKGLGGPQGVGGAVLGENANLEPFVRGGSGGRSESIDQPRWLPWSQEAGTMNGPGIAGLVGALSELTPASIAEDSRRVAALRERLEFDLQKIEGVTVVRHSSSTPPVGVLSFVADEITSSSFGALLEERFNILVRTGLHCAPVAHQTLGTFDDGTVRISIDAKTTLQEIDTAVDAINQIFEDKRVRDRKVAV